MELDVFVRDSLKGVLEGIKKANKEFDQHYFVMNSHSGDQIEFDVAVTVTNESGKSGGGGLRIAVAELGGEASSKASTEVVSRIKFKVRAAFNGMGSVARP